MDPRFFTTRKATLGGRDGKRLVSLPCPGDNFSVTVACNLPRALLISLSSPWKLSVAKAIFSSSWLLVQFLQKGVPTHGGGFSSRFKAPRRCEAIRPSPTSTRTTSSASNHLPPYTYVSLMFSPTVRANAAGISSVGPNPTHVRSPMYWPRYLSAFDLPSIRYHIRPNIKVFARNTDIEHPIPVPCSGRKNRFTWKRKMIFAKISVSTVAL